MKNSVIVYCKLTPSKPELLLTQDHTFIVVKRQILLHDSLTTNATVMFNIFFRQFNEKVRLATVEQELIQTYLVAKTFRKKQFLLQEGDTCKFIILWGLLCGLDGSV